MKDFFRQTLYIGDFVALEQPRYRNLVLGRVFAFTPKQVRVLWNNPVSSGTSRKFADIDGVLWENEFVTPPNTLVKKPLDIS
jgi:hypothetical protein